MDNSAIDEIIDHVEALPSPCTRLLMLSTTDYLDALNLAKQLNESYPNAKFEALRHTPNMCLSVHKY